MVIHPQARTTPQTLPAMESEAKAGSGGSCQAIQCYTTEYPEMAKPG